MKALFSPTSVIDRRQLILPRFTHSIDFACYLRRVWRGVEGDNQWIISEIKSYLSMRSDVHTSPAERYGRWTEWHHSPSFEEEENYFGITDEAGLMFTGKSW